ncbi:Ubiquinone/menaquinone biosynthesis C-methylase UbiE [Butyrivibrio sp. ob235]|uniref:class I SAM-dependent methyltransferase n=1 Tax=Butyrivibrio sp. ob235 TaxID=1761780 RepID=UPI0008ACB1B0|nr:class I SAM-dependent methyltransferase [Butyrivibrio sp. ob235]SEK68295.1 Ubiquinone/menaquinone biosynthesis C-methylase UbiE [Butyrivibrio sp. ob235]
MAKQNIYDNETFFNEYSKLREREVNANNLFEIPTLYALMPDLEGKRVLDLGCGTGERCIDYLNRGAIQVTGIDISEKMLAVAKSQNSDPRITYIKMPMEDIGTIDGEFDVVISSLALHYVEDFQGVVANVYRLLSDGGIFLFSQEHPINTCFSGEFDRWTCDENGTKIYANIANYCVEKRYESTWFVEGIQRYHRMFSTTINTLADAGFKILRIEEPHATEEIVQKYPDYYDLYHKPDFLFVKACK